MKTPAPLILQAQHVSGRKPSKQRTHTQILRVGPRIKRLFSRFALALACVHPRTVLQPVPLLPPFRLLNHPQRTNHIATMADNDSPVTLRTRKFIRNPLLGRKQFVV